MILTPGLIPEDALLALEVGAAPVGFVALNVCSAQPHVVGELAEARSGAMGGVAPVTVGGARGRAMCGT